LLKTVLVPLLLSFLYSLFIYLAHFDLSSWFLEFVVGFGVLYFLFSLDKKELFLFGFFSGVLWFYWIGFSFRYYDASSVAIPSVLFVATIIGLMFLVAGFIKNIYLKIVYLLFFDSFALFGFDWMKLELMFVNTPFMVSKWVLLIILMSAALAYKKSRLFFLTAPLLIFFLDHKSEITMPRSAMYLAQTNISQSIKWDSEFTHRFDEQNLQIIENAQKSGFGMTVLPESAFPYYLNRDKDMMEKLLELSKDSLIFAGSLFDEDGISYNSAFIFKDGNYTVAKKTVLVPFGESVPLPSPLDRWVNDMFFGGASDFIEASLPTDFEYMGDMFRAAICYEATHEKIYENAPPFIVAISNNAWFTPSIEPTLQKLLLKHYAKKYKKVIFHSVNGSPSYIIRP